MHIAKYDSLFICIAIMYYFYYFIVIFYFKSIINLLNLYSVHFDTLIGTQVLIDGN